MFSVYKFPLRAWLFDLLTLDAISTPREHTAMLHRNWPSYIKIQSLPNVTSGWGEVMQVKCTINCVLLWGVEPGTFESWDPLSPLRTYIHPDGHATILVTTCNGYYMENKNPVGLGAQLKLMLLQISKGYNQRVHPHQVTEVPRTTQSPCYPQILNLVRG